MFSNNSSSYLNSSSSLSDSPWANYVECTSLPGLEDVAIEKEKKSLQDKRSLLQIEDMNMFGRRPSWEEYCLCNCPFCNKVFQPFAMKGHIGRCKARKMLGDKGLKVLEKVRAHEREKIACAQEDPTQKTFTVYSYSEDYHPSPPNCALVIEKASDQNPKEIDPSYNCDVHCGVVYRDYDKRCWLVCKNFLLACPDHKDQIRDRDEADKKKMTESLIILKASLMNNFKDKVLESEFDPSVHCGFQFKKKFVCGRLLIECTQHMAKKRKITRPKSYEELEIQMIDQLASLLKPKPPLVYSRHHRRSSRHTKRKYGYYREDDSDRHLSVLTNSNNLQNQKNGLQKDDNEKPRKPLFIPNKILKPLPQPTCTFKPIAILKFFEDYRKMNSTSNNCLLQVSSSSPTAQPPKRIIWNKFLGCVPRRREDTSNIMKRSQLGFVQH